MRLAYAPDGLSVVLNLRLEFSEPGCDACDFAAETAHGLKNQLDSAWTGWSIEVRNAEGKKYFTLALDGAETSPLIDPNDPGPETTTKPDELRDQAGNSLGRLLIVEDAEVHSAVIDRVAAKLGFTTSKAHSYEAACRALSAERSICGRCAMC
jgi:hypothetical protein